MLVGYAVNPEGDPATTKETILLALFPIGMCVGYVAAWCWPFVGGIISVLCILVYLVALGELDMVGIVLVLGTPGILFLINGFLGRRLKSGSGS
jgi:hypothetical protein